MKSIHFSYKKDKFSPKYFLLKLKVYSVLIIVTLLSCRVPKLSPVTPESTVHPTSIPSTTAPTSMSTQSITPLASATIQITPTGTPTATISPSPSPSNSATPTIEYRDIRSSLTPGTYIAYWYNDKLYVQSLDDHRIVQLMPYSSTKPLARLSPDGNRIAFVDSKNQITILDLDTGQMTAYPNTSLLNYILTLEWSPDGHKILYSGAWGLDIVTETNIYVIDLDKASVDCLISWEDWPKFWNGGSNPSWSPGGEWIAFTNSKYGDRFIYETYMMSNSCLDAPVECKEEAKLVGKGEFFSWSPLGELTYNCSIGGLFGPCVVNPDSLSNPRLLADTNTLFPDFDNLIITLARWSHNGRYLALDVRTVKKNFDSHWYGDIYLVTSDGKEVRNITNTEYYEYLNGWSPDDQYIAYSNYLWTSETKISDIFIVPAQGGEAINLTKTPDEDEEFAFWMVIN